MLEQLGDLPLFRLQLLGVGEVLILAAAALAKEGTFWSDAVWRGFEHLDEVGLAVVLVIAKDAALHELAREREGDEDDPAIDTGDSHALVGEVFDPDVELLVVGEGMRFEFARRFRASRYFFSGLSRVI